MITDIIQPKATTLPVGFSLPVATTQSVSPIEPIGVSCGRAATMIGISERTMWNIIKAGKVRSVRIGNRVIVSVQSLKEYIDGI